MTAQPSTDSIWSQLSADLRRFIRRRVSDEHVAEDLLQETFVRIHRHVNSLADADRLVAWVYQIARNVILDHYRSPPGEAVALGETDVWEEPENRSMVRCPSAKWLNELIGKLPAGHQEAVRLAEIEGLSQQEVANRQGLSLSGAKSRVQRGRAMLKELLEQCCRFEFDRRGNLMEVDPKPDRTMCRDCGSGESAHC
jgi:RNA polymerase sigma-70 factor (ECF subfamily)